MFEHLPLCRKLVHNCATLTKKACLIMSGVQGWKCAWPGNDLKNEKIIKKKKTTKNDKTFCSLLSHVLFIVRAETFLHI